MNSELMSTGLFNEVKIHEKNGDCDTLSLCFKDIFSKG